MVQRDWPPKCNIGGIVIIIRAAIGIVITIGIGIIGIRAGIITATGAKSCAA